MNILQNKRLYESIMKNVAKQVKNALNEDNKDERLTKIKACLEILKYHYTDLDDNASIEDTLNLLKIVDNVELIEIYGDKGHWIDADNTGKLIKAYCYFLTSNDISVYLRTHGIINFPKLRSKLFESVGSYFTHLLLQNSNNAVYQLLEICKLLKK